MDLESGDRVNEMKQRKAAGCLRNIWRIWLNEACFFSASFGHMNVNKGIYEKAPVIA